MLALSVTPGRFQRPPPAPPPPHPVSDHTIDGGGGGLGTPRLWCGVVWLWVASPLPVVWCGSAVGFGGSPPSPLWRGVGWVVPPCMFGSAWGVWQTHAHDDIDDDDDNHDHHYYGGTLC